MLVFQKVLRTYLMDGSIGRIKSIGDLKSDISLHDI